MEHKEGPFEESWSKQMPFMASTQSLLFSDQPFDVANSLQREQNMDYSSLLDYGSLMESLLSKFDQTPRNLPSLAGRSSNDQNKFPNTEDSRKKEMLHDSKVQDWDPRAMLSNLSFLEQKIHQLQEIVHIFIDRRGQVSTCTDELVAQQQQLITADVSSIAVQLVSMASSLLPSVKNGPVEANPLTGLIGQSNGFLFPPTTSNGGGAVEENVKSLDQTNGLDPSGSCMDDHELKDEDEPNDEEHLPPGSYEILQLEKEEILAPHTHFCTMCGKGFKRDANLRMHMRGHGDEYKTPAALAKPHKDSNRSEPVLPKRYSCPYTSCKRNKEHKKFQPLKTILCVKNHYKRTHCDKTYTCSRCNTKKFSVIADLKTHEKHCGREKWLCSCGTTFSRKDKLFGHIALFQGHTPAIPFESNKGSASTSVNALESDEASYDRVGSMDHSFASDNSYGIGSRNIVDVRMSIDESFFTLPGFDDCNILQEFSQSAFDDPGTPFPFPLSEIKNGLQSGTDDIDS